MTLPSHHRPDPALDLILERVVAVPPERVWRAWTTPALLTQWFTPAPWKTVECELELWPGGAFTFVMESPEGERHPNLACILEVVPGQRLVWTVALEAGFRPARAPHPVAVFTAIITIEPHGTGTKYTAIAMHQDPAAAARHDQLGFHEGWGAALDQLVAVATAL